MQAVLLITFSHRRQDRYIINNAGYGSFGALEDVPLSEAKYQFDVNVFGIARLTQLVLPHMKNNIAVRLLTSRQWVVSLVNLMEFGIIIPNMLLRDKVKV